MTVLQLCLGHKLGQKVTFYMLGFPMLQYSYSNYINFNGWKESCKIVFEYN